jgi:putative ABC transport system substrate-binding protein
MVEVSEVQAAARTLGVDVATSEMRQTADVNSAFELLKNRADALYIVPDPLANTNRILIGTLALGARLPMMCGFREFVEAGCLMSYGPNLPDLYRRAAEFADKILRGAECCRPPPILSSCSADGIFPRSCGRAMACIHCSGPRISSLPSRSSR